MAEQYVKNLGIRHNVSFNIYDEETRKLVRRHQGHNSATNSMLTGIGHYLAGDGIFNQGYEMLRYWVPQYISLGTMGLRSQEEDPETGLPLHIGSLGSSASDQQQCEDYMRKCPGYTADGHNDGKHNNGRTDEKLLYLGLGPKYEDRVNKDDCVDCELVSGMYPRSSISFREVIPETQAEVPNTVDVVLTAMISTGALKQFRQNDRDYIFITEAGLWSVKKHVSGVENGLLAGYRILPPNQTNWDMSVPENRQRLRQEILRVGFNQIVQVIWKIQIGSIEDLEKIYI